MLGSAIPKMHCSPHFVSKHTAGQGASWLVTYQGELAMCCEKCKEKTLNADKTIFFFFSPVPCLPLDFLFFPPYFPFSPEHLLSSPLLPWPTLAEEKPLSHICVALLLLAFLGRTFTYPIFHSAVTAWPEHSTFSSHRCFYRIHACFLETWQKESYFSCTSTDANDPEPIYSKLLYPIFVFLNICVCFSIYMRKS